MKCSTKDCERDVYWEPTGLCLNHEKKRRAREATKATKTTTKRAAKKAEGGDA